MKNTLTMMNQSKFLLSIKQGIPKYELMEFENIEKLPALQWKIKNIQKMDAEKQKSMLQKLEKVLFS